MGTTAKEEKKKGGAGGGGKGKGDKREKASRGPHPGANLPVPTPRLRTFYQETVRPKLKEQFGFKNPHEIPTLEKIVINVGLGEAIKQPRLLDGIVEELATITGQHPVKKKAKKSIANFGLRQGQEIGAAVTLRGPVMWEFLDRLIAVAIPRIRDFRGLPTKSFDGRGNYSMGLKEQMMFPEINYDDIEMIHGMDITMVTSAERDDHALALLKELGMPFRTTEDKKGGR
ncbi:MAG TPA: 50S ribosomal protein L5 [Gemmatimonadaceae bacterium]|nr:50S ribosomal protein L5 [Gemmatimonadaceae bacterium]